MNCLCCGKPIRAEHASNGWHMSCIKKFFDTARIPEIEISEMALESLAIESTKKVIPASVFGKEQTTAYFGELSHRIYFETTGCGI